MIILKYFRFIYEKNTMYYLVKVVKEMFIDVTGNILNVFIHLLIILNKL